MKRLGESSAYRAERGEFMLEGAKLLTDAAANGAEIREILYCGDRPQGAFGNASMQEVSSRHRMILIEATGETKALSETDGAWENLESLGRLAIGTSGLGGKLSFDRYAMGAVFREKTFRLSLEELTELKKKNGVTLYGAALGEDSSDIRSTKLTGSAVCIGNEGRGLSGELLELCDKSLIIPMAPECESLNAAAAATVFMWEMAKDIL